MKNVELYYNKDKTAFAVLVSHGYGSGWSTWNMQYPEIAYDKRIITWYLLINDETIFSKIRNAGSVESQLAHICFKEWGYNTPYLGGLKSNMIEWVPVGSIWRVSEYDGAECIEYLDLQEWNQFE